MEVDKSICNSCNKSAGRRPVLASEKARLFMSIVLRNRGDESDLDDLMVNFQLVKWNLLTSFKTLVKTCL